MPASSSRRLRSRREPDLQPSDADTPDSIATPTRKRRRLNGSERAAAAAVAEDVPRTRITESVQSDDSNKTLENGAELDGPTDPVERQNLLITHLVVPKNYTPNAAIDYANDLQARMNEGTIPAFAKIAARDWCFFVKKTTLLIGRADASGRPPNNRHTSSQGERSEPPQSDDVQQQQQSWGVDIDLGPERQVSRVHAQIDFDTTEQAWFITVNSRNGLKLDDHAYYRGARAPLHSGICISIMGTQMLFLLANVEDRFHPMLWRQVKYDGEQEESDGAGNQPPYRSLPHAHPKAPTPKSERRDPFPPSSHPRSQRPAGSQLTSTPGHQPGTPLALRSVSKEPRSKQSPSAYPRGMMLDSTEEIDYCADASKDIKPPHSYAQLIGQAILSSPEEMLTLANIYQFIKDRYAFFRHSTGGWQNSIRHNLSLSKSFEKVARRTDEPGKGMKWRIADDQRDEFVKKTLFSTRKGQARMDSSGPSSPAIKDPAQATERLMGALNQGDSNVFGKHESAASRIKTPPGSATPPLASYPAANESYTPDRGPQHSFGGYKSLPVNGNLSTPAKKLFGGPGNPPVFSQNSDPQGPVDASDRPEDISQSPEGKKRPKGLRDSAAQSPPPLYSDSAANNSNGNTDVFKSNHAGLVTPLVTRHAPRLAPPSTAQVPSQYMNFSSPAPFWKFIDLPSTPAGAPHLDISPIKMKRNDSNEEEDQEAAQPSSPPIMFGEDGKKRLSEESADKEPDNEAAEAEDDMEINSPTRTVSRPVSRRDLPNLGARERSAEKPQPPSFNGMGIGNGGMVRGPSLPAFDEEETEGIDLAKGFQKIGSFHRSMAQNQGVLRAP